MHSHLAPVPLQSWEDLEVGQSRHHREGCRSLEARHHQELVEERKSQADRVEQIHLAAGLGVRSHLTVDCRVVASALLESLGEPEVHLDREAGSCIPAVVVGVAFVKGESSAS